MLGDPLRLMAALVVGANVALAMWIVFRGQPRWAVVTWAVALFFTPVYVTFSLPGVALAVLDMVTILAVITLWPGVRLGWSVVDTLMIAALAVILAGLAFGGVWGHAQYTLVYWFLPYIWGRIAVARVGSAFIGTCISVAAIIASAIAVIEFSTGVNLFVQLPGASASIWAPLQYRGGILRAEGAFGHSISLGSSLAIASAFVLACAWRWWLKAGALLLVSTAVVMTLSRIGLVGLVLVLVLSAIFLGHYIRAAHRAAAAAILVVLAALALPFISTVFDDAGEEAAGSADYRANLLPLIGEMNVIGVSDARRVLATGEDYFGSFRSIDSALILTGLRHGYLPLLIFIAMLVICVVVVLAGRGSPAAVAVASQIPALATVALITQYSPFLWFVAGVAVSSYSVDRWRDGVDARHRGATADAQKVLVGKQ